MSLLNKSKVRAYALEQSRNLRNGRFKRVSKEFIDELEITVRQTIAARVHRAPTKGVTL